MKKRATLSLIVFSCIICTAQTEKGSISLSGKSDLSYMFSRARYDFDKGSAFRNKTSSVNANLGIAYFAANNFSVGLSGSFMYSQTRENGSKYPNFRNWTAGIIPMATYYFPVKGDLKPGISAGAGYMWVFSDGINAGGLTLNVAPGLSYFINRSLSIDLGVQYSHNKLEDKDGTYTSQTQDIIGLLAGVSVYF